MDPRNISISDYTYTLPDSFIALYPLADRDASRLLVYRNGKMSETIYRNIAEELPSGSTLVFNDTRVVEARIVFQKPSGGKVEIFCLEPPPEYGGMAAAMARTGEVRWKCLIGGASKWKPGQLLTKIAGDIVVEARYLEKQGDAFLIGLSWHPAELSFAALLHRTGLVPLPPYMHRLPDAADSSRYQTIYAEHEGSVAAPTAGLHFTGVVLSSLQEKGIGRLFVTLHVGAATFLPVKSQTLGGHPMHTEYISVTREAIEALRTARAGGNPVIAVGTTSARTIESLYWLGLKVLAAPRISLSGLIIEQWDAYEIAGNASAESALSALLEWIKARELSGLVTTTQLLITPGYRWRVADGLITNFHQPESTLLLLVASLIGEDWRKLYDHALARGFRFLSYGDGCLLLPKLVT